MDPLFSLSIAYALAAVFALGVLHKAADLRGFVRTVAAYELLPASLARIVAPLLLFAEAMATAALLSTPMRTFGAVLGVLLLLLYGAAVAVNLRRGRTHIDCGCFWGKRGAGLTRHLVIRNLVMAMLAMPLLLPAGTRALTATDYASAILTAVAVAVLFLAAESLQSLRQRS